MDAVRLKGTVSTKANPARRLTSELRKDSLFSIPECERQPLSKTYKKLPKQTVEVSSMKRMLKK